MKKLINKIISRTKNIVHIKKIINERNDYFIDNQILKKNIENIEKSKGMNVNTDWTKDVLIKKKGLIINKNTIETLIIGSSHGEYGLNTQHIKNSYNLCMASQDLYYSYELYKKSKIPNLKNIILFYSTFSPGFNLIETSEKQRCILYKQIFNIPYKTKNNTLNEIEKEYGEYIKIIKQYLIIDNKYFGYSPRHSFYKMNDSIKKRAETHYRENIRINNQLKYLKLINKYANNNNQNLSIIISPVTKEYRSHIPNSSTLFKSLFDITNELGIKVYNFYDNNIFTKNDFWDSDHLNNQGAVKLTKLIGKNIL